jgi:FkbM family methyltransferase
MSMIKKFIKAVLKKLPFDFTKNQKYDTQTKKILARLCGEASNCIDIGCHKGEVLDWILAAAPKGEHWGFEPLPDMYADLLARYADVPNCRFSDIALSAQAGETSFNYVVSNPAYSGLQRRKYDKPDEKDQMITVKTARLDDILPSDFRVDFIKLDVEGGELQVLQGAQETLRRWRPVLVFEHGLGAADCYGTKPSDIYALLSACDMQISLMENWLKGAPALTLSQFEQQFYKAINYYFIAYPKNTTN